MLKKYIISILNNGQLKASTQRGLSLICLSISGLLSLLRYSRPSFIPLKIFESSFTFRPSLLTTSMALILVAPLYLRRIFKWKRSVYSFIFFFLTVLVSSSFIELAVGGNESNKLMWILLSSAIILSWIGIRSIAGLSWLLVMTLGIYFAIDHSRIMGFWGFVYTVSAFIGFLFHSGLNPGEFFYEIKREYHPDYNKCINCAKDCIKESKKVLNKSKYL